MDFVCVEAPAFAAAEAVAVYLLAQGALSCTSPRGNFPKLDAFFQGCAAKQRPQISEIALFRISDGWTAVVPSDGSVPAMMTAATRHRHCRSLALRMIEGRLWSYSLHEGAQERVTDVMRRAATLIFLNNKWTYISKGEPLVGETPPQAIDLAGVQKCVLQFASLFGLDIGGWLRENSVATDVIHCRWRN